jgi:peptidoglycan/xylan/chitin deacetylase (PgdA/CDA1 family)
MTRLRDAERDAERDRFLALLDAAAEQSRKIPFWWRDDDAETATPELERLLALMRRHDLPLALAVIPKGATDDLARRLANERRIAVLQHGWQHRNHSPPDEKKMELGDHRPVAAVLEELGEGYERLGRLFPQKFLPVLVPPWNRIPASVRDARHEAGLTGFSAFGPAPPQQAHWVNTHVDIIDWLTRGPLARSDIYRLLCRELERRLGGDAEPLGILTHHLMHQDASWDFLDELFSLTGRHPASVWPSIPQLFALPPCPSRDSGGTSRRTS